MRPTIIDINASVDTDFTDVTSPYYQRTALTLHVNATTQIDRVDYKHLGFHACHDSEHVRRKGDLYTYIGFLEPKVDAEVTISSFKLYLKNIGDSLLAIHVRLPAEVERCKITILQEQYQQKAPKVVDSFVQYQNIWYATATVNCLQTLKIEEVTQALKGDS